MNTDQSSEESSRTTMAIEKVVDTLYKGNTQEKVAYFFKATFNNIISMLSRISYPRNPYNAVFL